MQKIMPPNILATKPIATTVLVGRHWYHCLITKVAHKDTLHTRHIWCDVELLDTTQQRYLKHVPMEDFHYRDYPRIVSASFHQEETDELFYRRLHQRYACRVSFKLEPLYQHRSWHWLGMLAIEAPRYGVLCRWDTDHYDTLPHVSSIQLDAGLPYDLYVHDKQQVVAECTTLIQVGKQYDPCVAASGDLNIISPTYTIDGRLYSGRSPDFSGKSLSGRIEHDGSIRISAP